MCIRAYTPICICQVYFRLGPGASKSSQTLGMVPFSSTSRGAPLWAGRGSPSSRQTQQKREWRMPRLRGFWETADFWSPEARCECRHTGLQGLHALRSQSPSSENVSVLPPSGDT